jgi:F-type H+-transporting ATPase subunit delta
VSVQAQPRNYAQVLYDLAFKTWTQQLSEVQRALLADSTLRDAVNDTGKTPSERLALLEAVSPGGLVPSIRKFLGILIENEQVDQLGTILAEFGRLVHRQEERPQAIVTSAIDLPEGDKQTLRTRLAGQYGSDLEVSFEVDASLLGGLVLRVGDRVVDGSVAGKLAAMRDRLTS